MASQRARQGRVADFLEERARMTNSRVLSLLAEKASSEPFKKVSKMIEDMIYKLMEEANEEAEHKGFCDTEMGTNKATRDEKTSQVDELKASIEKMSASISTLASEVADLSQEIIDTDAAVAKATEVRTAEKEKNAVTIADAQAAIAAVTQATEVLKEFYAKAAQATALTQMQAGQSWGPDHPMGPLS